MTTRPPKASRIAIPQRYVPSFATDIRKTIKAEQKRLATVQKVVKVPALHAPELDLDLSVAYEVRPTMWLPSSVVRRVK